MKLETKDKMFIYVVSVLASLVWILGVAFFVIAANSKPVTVTPVHKTKVEKTKSVYKEQENTQLKHYY